jgi:hypothetical protein
MILCSSLLGAVEYTATHTNMNMDVPFFKLQVIGHKISDFRDVQCM